MEKGQRGGAVQEGDLVVDNTRRWPCVGCHSRVQREWGQKALGGSAGSPNTHPHSWPQTPGAALSGVTMASNRTKIAGEAAHSSSCLQGKWELDASPAVTHTVQHCWRVWDQSLNDFSTVD